MLHNVIDFNNSMLHVGPITILCIFNKRCLIASEIQGTCESDKTIVHKSRILAVYEYKAL